MNHVVIAILEAKAEKIEELKKELIKVSQLSREEPTNIAYQLHQGKDEPNQFILYEIWDTPESHQAQFTKPYITEIAAKLDSLLAKPFSMHSAEVIDQ